MRQASFRDRAGELGGYDVSEAGTVRLVNQNAHAAAATPAMCRATSEKA